MTGSEAIAYIENYTWSTTRLGLERTCALLHALGDPQKRLKFIHVAGSNGKGSTCAMLASVLQAAGYQTGLYISPYIETFCERMQVNGKHISPETLAAITEQVRTVADDMEDHPSQFELVTAIAMVYFLQAGCDIVVLEVGMGGALDSTNVIDAPEAAVITNIGLEHTEYLGSTLEEIARTKAGIIKCGCHCVCYDGDPAVTQIIRTVCREKQVPFRLAECGRITPLSRSLHGQSFLWQEESYRLPLLGVHQLRNAAVVMETIDTLRARGWHIPDTAVQRGLSHVCWPARLEVLRQEPLFILDGGHNPQCAQALAAVMADYLPGQKVTFLVGVLADKEYHTMLDAVMPYAKRFVCLTPDSPRALPAENLAAVLQDEYKADAIAFDSTEKAIEHCCTSREPVVAFGSLYMAGAIRQLFR